MSMKFKAGDMVRVIKPSKGEQCPTLNYVGRIMDTMTSTPQGGSPIHMARITLGPPPEAKSTAWVYQDNLELCENWQESPKEGQDIYGYDLTEDEDYSFEIHKMKFLQWTIAKGATACLWEVRVKYGKRTVDPTQCFLDMDQCLDAIRGRVEADINKMKDSIDYYKDKVQRLENRILGATEILSKLPAQ